METFEHLIAQLIGGIKFGPTGLIQVTLGVRHVKVVARFPEFSFGTVNCLDKYVRVPTAPSFCKNGRSGIR